jgi:phenylacetate-CoA ligase
MDCRNGSGPWANVVERVRSDLPGIAWPAVPGTEAAGILALQFQLERSQWLAPERLREHQFRQLDALLRHAHATVPYYLECWRDAYDPAAPLTPERFARLPLLARGDVQRNREALRSALPPPAHGSIRETRSTGSTGMPVRVLKTELTELVWRSFVLREHSWHRRDLAGKLAAIRHASSPAERNGWGAATDATVATGRAVTLPIATDVPAQLDWLQAHQPDYLLTYPTNLAELARQSLARGIRLPGLREARTMGERLPQETRDLCRAAWGVAVIDMYTANEVGYIALQCPEHEHYHVQAEGVMVEVLDAQGTPCGPGEIGRVVVTVLHNFAMPLIRYEVGDYAMPGPPCPCGRGLPVLARIMGRSRNMLRLPGGVTRWPGVPMRALTALAPLRQFRLVQYSLTGIEVQLVTDRPLAGDEEDALRDTVRARLQYPFDVRFARVERIERGPGYKFEDFVCEVP